MTQLEVGLSLRHEQLALRLFSSNSTGYVVRVIAQRFSGKFPSSIQPIIDRWPHCCPLSGLDQYLLFIILNADAETISWECETACSTTRNSLADRRRHAPLRLRSISYWTMLDMFLYYNVLSLLYSFLIDAVHDGIQF